MTARLAAQDHSSILTMSGGLPGLPALLGGLSALKIRGKSSLICARHVDDERQGWGSAVSVTILKRQSKRVRTLLDARLNSSLGAANVRVRDVSREGALVETGADIANGGDVALEFLGFNQPGTIMWRDGSWLGVQFHTALPDGAWTQISAPQMRVSAPRRFRHDQIEDDPERLDIIPRRIEMRLETK